MSNNLGNCCCGCRECGDAYWVPPGLNPESAVWTVALSGFDTSAFIAYLSCSGAEPMFADGSWEMNWDSSYYPHGHCPGYIYICTPFVGAKIFLLIQDVGSGGPTNCTFLYMGFNIFEIDWGLGTPNCSDIQASDISTYRNACLMGVSGANLKLSRDDGDGPILVYDHDF